MGTSTVKSKRLDRKRGTYTNSEWLYKYTALLSFVLVLVLVFDIRIKSIPQAPEGLTNSFACANHWP